MKLESSGHVMSCHVKRLSAKAAINWSLQDHVSSIQVISGQEALSEGSDEAGAVMWRQVMSAQEALSKGSDEVGLDAIGAFRSCQVNLSHVNLSVVCHVTSTDT